MSDVEPADKPDAQTPDEPGTHPDAGTDTDAVRETEANADAGPGAGDDEVDAGTADDREAAESVTTAQGPVRQQAQEQPPLSLTLPESGPEDFTPGTSQRPDRVAAAFAALEERQGTLRDDRNRWFRIAILMSLVATVCAGFGIWAAVRSEYIPYIVAVDDLGRVQPVQAPKVIENWPDAAVRRELADLVSDWRSITSDPVVLRQRYRRLQYFLEENSAADRKVRQWAIETRPLTRAETDTVDVAVTSVNFVGGSTWLVEWTENRRPRATGQIDETTRWRGSFVLRKRRITDPAWLTNNPFGMIIEDIDARRLDT